MQEANNFIELCGVPEGRPVFSHMSRNENYYTFPLCVQRLSGNSDTLNIIVRESVIQNLEIGDGKMRIRGEVRSFNNKSGEGNRLVITVFAKEIEFCQAEDANIVQIAGVICKPTNLRWTPMGREICDIMVAVNRKYGRSDYLPCIAWGNVAARAASWTVGSEILISGRLQSRTYIKNENGVPTEKTAFEISVFEAEKTGMICG